VRVLVVDGSSAVGVRLAARLREAGLEVVAQAARGDAAIELTAALRPDVVVIDPHLPDQSAAEVLPALRARAPAAVLMVHIDDPGHRHRAHCRALGADFFFDKSSEYDGLAAMLEVIGGLRPRS